MECKEDWCIREKGLERERIGFWEGTFTISNGYIGLRGVLEEGFDGFYPGTYIAGIYDKSEAITNDLVNVPNPLGLRITVDGKAMDIDSMDVVEHTRYLELKRARLVRRTIFMDGEGREFEYTSRRFFTPADVHIGVMEFSIRPLTQSAEITLERYIDGRTVNAVQPFGPPVRHYDALRMWGEGATSYLEAKTLDYGLMIGIGLRTKGPHGVAFSSMGNKGVSGHRTTFRAERGRKYRFVSFIGVYTSRDTEGNIEEVCLEHLRNRAEKGMGAVTRAHTGAWSRRWSVCNIETGLRDIDRNMKFNIYHLLSSAPAEDMDVSIGAKTLSGEWYKGHVFWDNEIYVLPFFIFQAPKIARALLMYRYRRIDKAREKARLYGFRGAFWPWESALTGRDETPKEWVNFDGTKIPVYNMEREVHICGDIIYGLYLYYLATGDEGFMLRAGCEMAFETARFWASRVDYDGKNYHIRKVVGPNEFQECVDDNAYTNFMAAFTLRFASELYQVFNAKYPRKFSALRRALGLNGREVDEWLRIAERMHIPKGDGGLIEEFSGYFRLRDVVLERGEKGGMPLWPKDVPLSEVKHTQLVKQADVVLLFHLFPDRFDKDSMRRNLEYYDLRTTHKSSLSPPSYAMAYAALGDSGRAYKYFLRALKTDLEDIYGNTDKGIHAAALGGSWQALVMGLGGVRVGEGGLHIEPHLPSDIPYLKLNLWYYSTLLSLTIRRDELEVRCLKGRGGCRIIYKGRSYTLGKGTKLKVM